MKKYRVCLIKYETYYVDAENEDEAIDAACFMDEDNGEAWLAPIDEYEVVEVKI